MAARRRVFWGNFGFEAELAEPGGMPSRILQRLEAELSPSWLAVAEPGDILLIDDAWDDGFLTDFVARRTPGVEMVCIGKQTLPSDVIDADNQRGVEFVPWGWSPSAVAASKRWKFAASPPPLNAVRVVNSREFSFALEQSLDVAPATAVAIRSLSEWHAWCGQCTAESTWVAKANWSNSARERLIWRGAPFTNTVAWGERRIARDSFIVVEPWLDRVAEASGHFDVPRDGPPIFVGVVPLFCGPHGMYLGSRVLPQPDRTGLAAAWWTAACFPAWHAAALAVQQAGYFGPLGIDAMLHRPSSASNGARSHLTVSRDGAGDSPLAIRPLQDINARWTMGRLSLGWSRWLGPADVAVWRHGAAAQRMAPLGESTEWKTDRQDDGEVGDQRSVCGDGPTCDVERMDTSPARMGGQPTSRGSWLEIRRIG